MLEYSSAWADPYHGTWVRSHPHDLKNDPASSKEMKSLKLRTQIGKTLSLKGYNCIFVIGEKGAFYVILGILSFPHFLR